MADDVPLYSHEIPAVEHAAHTPALSCRCQPFIGAINAGAAIVYHQRLTRKVGQFDETRCAPTSPACGASTAPTWTCSTHMLGLARKPAAEPQAYPDPNEFLPRMQAAIDDPANAAVAALLSSARDEVHHAWLVCDAAVFDAVKAEQSTRQQCVLWMQEARSIASERDDLRVRLAKLDRIEAKVPELIAWAQSYRMHHVAIALRDLVADEPEVPDGA